MDRGTYRYIGIVCAYGRGRGGSNRFAVMAVPPLQLLVLLVLLGVSSVAEELPGVLEVPGALSRAECQKVAHHGARVLRAEAGLSRSHHQTRFRHGTAELRGGAALPWLEKRLRRLARLARDERLGELELVRYQQYKAGGFGAGSAARAWHR